MSATGLLALAVLTGAVAVSATLAPIWRRRLGDLYAREGLSREAQTQYERAREIEAGA